MPFDSQPELPISGEDASLSFSNELKLIPPWSMAAAAFVFILMQYIF